MNIKLMLLILFVKSISGFSQDSFTLAIHQDTRFLYSGDIRGNHKGTLDILIKAEIPIIKLKKSYFVVFPSFEYAALHSSEMSRYSVGVGYIQKEIYFKNLNLGIFTDLGRIYRENKSSRSYGLNFEVSYRLTKRLSASIVHQILERTDLKLLYNDGRYTRNSSFIGFKVHF